MTVHAFQIRADHDDTTLVVYQAYRHAIADAAVKAGRFVEPWSRARMTWIKPSFTWMMHRCGWARKPDQERVLALRLTRSGFEHALRHACLSSFRPAVHGTKDEWQARLRQTSVRVQWDPERSLRDQELAHRSIQIGIGPLLVPAFADEWLVELTDITARVHALRAQIDAGDLGEAEALCAREKPYPLPAEIGSALGMNV